MQTSIRQSTKRSSQTSDGQHLVNQQYRNKDYKLELIPYQEYGVSTWTLWPKQSSVIRIVPGYDQSTGSVYRQNINCDQYSDDSPRTDYLSDTFHQANIVNCTGADGRRQVFCADYAPDSDDAMKWGGDTIIHLALRDIFYSVNSKTGSKPRIKPIPEWSNWCNFQTGNLKLDKPALLMQALTFMVNGRTHKDMDDNELVDENGNALPKFGVVVIDNRDTIKNVLQVLVEPTNRALPLDAITNNRYGGFAELDGIKMFFNPYTTDEGHNALRADIQAAGKGWTPEPFPLTADDVKSLWVPWEKLIHYMTADEQCRWLAAEFGADTVNYVVGNNRTLRGYNIPEDIAAAGFGRYAQVMGGSSITAAPSTVSVTPKFGQAARPAPAQASVPVAPAAQPGAQASSLGLKGVRLGGSVDIEKVKSTLAGIRAAAGAAKQMNSDADLAGELLDDTPLTAFDGQEG